MMVVTFASAGGKDLVGWQIAVGFAGLALINVGFVFGFGALGLPSESFPARLRSYGSSAMLTADQRRQRDHRPVLPHCDDGNRWCWNVLHCSRFSLPSPGYSSSRWHRRPRVATRRHPPVLGERWQVAHRRCREGRIEPAVPPELSEEHQCVTHTCTTSSTEQRKAPHVASRSGPGVEQRSRLQLSTT